MTGSRYTSAPRERPQAALARLLEGNARFADGKPLAPRRDLDDLRILEPGQTPFAAFLGCADSRVPIEIVFDAGFGDLFPVRVAGNVATPEVIGSLEFATHVLGAQVVMVLGHSGCGAVSATMEGHELPGQIRVLYRHLQPAVDLAEGSLDEAIAQNVRLQVRHVLESPVMYAMQREGALVVVGGVYELSTGRVQLLEDTV